MKTKTGRLIAALGLATIALAALTLALSTQSARAQGNEISVDKQLGRPSPVVHVGEYLTFTIEIRNNATFTITQLPLSDLYNNAVLGYADAVPPPDTIDTGTGHLEWNDLTNFFGDLAPGEQVVVVVGFIAEHPAPVVVNEAEVHDAIGSSGVLSDTTSTSGGAESVGGSSPVEKQFVPGSLTAQTGLRLMFTVIITNDGYTTMTVAPLVDTYDPTLLQFSYAVPPPDLMDLAGGVLTWTDVTSWTGDIPAHQSVSVMTVFTALAPIDNAPVNRAQVEGASDWYGNELAGGADDVPITIIQGPTPTPGPTDTPRPRPTLTPTPIHTATPAPAPTTTPQQPSHPSPTPISPTATSAAPTPSFLPESGRAKDGLNNGLLLMAALTAGLGTLILTRRKKIA